MHRPVQRNRRGAAPAALPRPRQPVPQLLALRLLAAAAHQRRRQQRLRLVVHLQPHARHAREEAGLDAQQRIAGQAGGEAVQPLPVLGEVAAAGVQEARAGVRLGRGALGQRTVQLRHAPPVQQVRCVGEPQVAGAFQHRLDPPAQPIPRAQRASVPGALLAETGPVTVHLRERGRYVRPQRVQPEPGVRHARVLADRGAELLLRLGIRRRGIGVDAAQPGQVGAGVRTARIGRALRARNHEDPHNGLQLPASGTRWASRAGMVTAIPRYHQDIRKGL